MILSIFSIVKYIIAKKDMNKIGALDLSHFDLKTVNFTEQCVKIDELCTIYSLLSVYYQYVTLFMQLHTNYEIIMIFIGLQSTVI